LGRTINEGEKEQGKKNLFKGGKCNKRGTLTNREGTIKFPPEQRLTPNKRKEEKKRKSGQRMKNIALEEGDRGGPAPRCQSGKMRMARRWDIGF